MSQKTASLKSAFTKIIITLCAVLLLSVLYIDAWLIEKINAKKWSIPAVVYARSLEIFQGQSVSQEQFLYELKANGYRQSDDKNVGSFQVDENIVAVHLRAFKFWDKQQSALSVKIKFAPSGISAMQTSTGEVRVRVPPLEITRIHTESLEDRNLVSLKDVPQSLIDALIITEDRDFYQHYGISPKGIMRALFSNAKEGKVVEGASTITQQLVKNFFLSTQRSYGRKFLEAIMALLLELHVTKNDILEAYINEVFVVQNGKHAIHGFALASQYLFGSPLQDLTIDQTALLVAMMKGPSYYNPVRHPARALERRNLILHMMQENGKISLAQEKTARDMPLEIFNSKKVSARFSAYVDLVRRQLKRDYSTEVLATPGLRVFTNMDPQWQWKAQLELQKGLLELENRLGKKAEMIDGSVVVVEHTNGEVLAIVGGKEAQFTNFNRALDARRPIGSLVKPAIYLTALQKGYTLTSLISDAPLTVKLPKGHWQPQNYDHEYHGEIPLYLALAKSYNVAAVRLGLSLGLNTVSKNLKNLGIEETLPQLPSLLLGTVELTPFNVSQMYSTIASHGKYSQLNSIRVITDYKGTVVQGRLHSQGHATEKERRFSADVMHQLDYALQSVVHEGTAKSVENYFAENKIIAGKTGTTNDQRDSWFAGYDSNKLVVVWLGRDENSSLPITGASGALPIWANIIAANLSHEGRQKVPDNIEYHWIEKKTGHILDEQCEGAVYLPFVVGSEPKEHSGCILKESSITHWFKTWFQ